MFCPKCGASNDGAATFCKDCGEVLPLPGAGFQQARGGVAAAPAGDDEYYKAAVGEKNQDYYLKHFARFDVAGKVSATWHWPAFWLSFYWLLYRKMWLGALVYFFLPYLILGVLGAIAAVMNGAGGTFLGAGYLLYLIGIVFLVPMYANAIYYHHCRKKIARAKASTPDVKRQLGELAAKGGTSNIAIIILLVLVLIAVLGIVAAIAIPAYQDYTTKARVAQAYELGRSAADSVSEYYQRNQVLPGDLGDTGFAAALPPSVSDVALDGQYGTLTVTLNGAVVNGQSLVLDAALDEGGGLYWSCTSAEIQERYLPRDCLAE